MHMLTGLMDHWVPSHDGISQFWKTPFETLVPEMERLLREVAVNNFTFYTKWYSNGLLSRHPWLVNHPQAQNVITRNDWGRRWIDWFHARGMTCGAMIQSYAYEPGMLPREHVLGTWKGTHRCIGRPEGEDCEIANPEWPGFTPLYGQMLEEQLREFPGLDAVFLEFEGLNSVPPQHAIAARVKGETVSPTVRAQSAESGWPLGAGEPWEWTPGGQAALERTLRAHISEAHNALDRAGFKGIRGVVFHAMGYETPYVLSALPTRDWWVLPWHYWGWGGNDSDALVRQQMDWCRRRFAAMAKAGHPLCYIGNCTLPTERWESIREMVAFSRDIGAAGYLGMGNPLPEYGLRWHGATDASVAQARDVCRQLFPRV